MKITIILILFVYHVNIIFSKLLCEELLEQHIFNENEIVKQIDRNMDILKSQQE